MYEFCEGDLDKFVLLLRESVYPYEYMHSWEKFEEMSLPDKKDFHSKLNSEDISDYDYEHAKKVWNVFEIKNVGEYHDLHVQTDALLLVMYLKILEINTSKHMSLIHYILYLLHH